MKFSLATVIAVAASAKAQFVPTTYSVTDFSASCSPFTLTCSVQFTVDGGTSCSGTGSASAGVFLPTIPSTLCFNPAYAFTFTPTGTGNIVLTIGSYTTDGSNTRLQGSYTILPFEMQINYYNGIAYQVYTGPTSFTVNIS